MKATIIISILLIVSNIGAAQDAMEILEKSKKKCDAVKSGYYEIVFREKNLTRQDTSYKLQSCYFEKLKKASSFNSRFHSNTIYKDKPYSSIYTGEDYISYSTSDSSGTVWSASLWKEDIESLSEDADFYPPFRINSQNIFPDKKDYKDSTFRIQYLGDGFVNNVKCYHIQTNYIPENDPSSPFQGLDIEYHFWINQLDMIPLQCSDKFILAMAGDTMVQYKLYTIQHIDLKSLVNDSLFSIRSVPEYIDLIEYAPREYKPPPPLPLDTIAPGWSFPSIADEMLSLDDFKGKLVLIDFFYKHCEGCILAFPMLQALHGKYKDQGLVIVGLDPYDVKEDNLPAFLAKRNVEYPVVYASKDIAKAYRVSVYPTLFLVGKEGRILLIEKGYHDGLEKELEEIIMKNL